MDKPTPKAFAVYAAVSVLAILSILAAIILLTRTEDQTQKQALPESAKVSASNSQEGVSGVLDGNRLELRVDPTINPVPPSVNQVFITCGYGVGDNAQTAVASLPWPFKRDVVKTKLTNDVSSRAQWCGLSWPITRPGVVVPSRFIFFKKPVSSNAEASNSDADFSLKGKVLTVTLNPYAGQRLLPGFSGQSVRATCGFKAGDTLVSTSAVNIWPEDSSENAFQLPEDVSSNVSTCSVRSVSGSLLDYTVILFK